MEAGGDRSGYAVLAALTPNPLFDVTSFEGALMGRWGPDGRLIAVTFEDSPRDHWLVNMVYPSKRPGVDGEVSERWLMILSSGPRTLPRKPEEDHPKKP